MKYIQAKLSNGNTFTIAWIEKKKKLKVGCNVELKETGEFWKVEELYSEIDFKKLLNKQQMNKEFGLSIKGI